MKSGQTLVELATTLENQQKSKADYIADTRSISMSETTNELSLWDANGGEVEVASPTAHCHRQIAQRLKIPQKYYDMMRSEAPALLADNVNHWFSANPEKRMVRTMAEDGVTRTARAFLSQRYRPLDNFDLATHVLPILTAVNGMTIESCQVTENRMYLKVVTDRIKGEVAVGDVVQCGMVVSNSEIGAGSLRIEPMMYRLVCKNGMIANDYAMKKYHIGKGFADTDETFQFVRDETRQKIDDAFWGQLVDVVGSVMTQDGFDTILAGVRKTVDCKIVDPVKCVTNVSEELGLADHEQGGVLRHLITGGDLSAYGVLNAITRFSQDVDDYERATELERLGGSVVKLADTKWQQMAG